MAGDASQTTQDPAMDGKPAAGDSAGGWESVKAWFVADRRRVFLAMAAVALLLGIALLLLPDNLVTVGAAFLLVGLAAVLGLLGLATWWAERRGLTDGQDLWDAEDAESDRPEDLLEGFSPFHSDGDPDPESEKA